MEELGGTVLEPEWLGSGTPHRVRCPEGHLCDPTPGNIRYGTGLCRVCAGLDWDVFYVVTDDEAGELKFGITSGAARPRLKVHARVGLRTQQRLLTGLPDGVALALERFVRQALLRTGESPLRGREYFSSSVLQQVLTIVDSYPIEVPGATAAVSRDHGLEPGPLTEGSELISLERATI
ncbi:hypothetical protein OG311_37345 [Streptomyces sp. NBC_01343]|uniref:hypothetical protein n=1 Tax=Streptomyces sp. NBC_01343 TaxID=2903832 RepID=UPI002E10409C|nr:hypothetical protein OG311_37345 [Streptomyces sp. NBC_01343]